MALIPRRIPLAESSFGAIGSQLLTVSTEGKPLNAATVAAEHYFQLTAKQVQAAFARHICPNAFATAVKGPGPKG